MRTQHLILFENDTVANDTIYSETIEITHFTGYSMWASYTGTDLNGFIKIEASLDATNWINLATSDQLIGNGGSEYLWNYSNVFYNYVRLRVTALNANTITVNARFNAKGW